MNSETIDFYSNGVAIATSLYEVRLNFRTENAVPSESDGELRVEQTKICNVRMSPQHAKSLAGLLVEHVVKYEKENNLKLPIPPHIEEMWKKHVKGE
jgi:hypothetical protein